MRLSQAYGDALGSLFVDSISSTAKITKPLADETALAMPVSFGESKGKKDQT